MNTATVMYSIVIILVIAALTFGARLFPFILFSRGGKTPALITYIGNILPPAVMIMLIVYCLKNVSLSAWSHGLPEFISIGTVVLLYKLTKNNLIAMVGGTILYMFLIQVVFS